MNATVTSQRHQPSLLASFSRSQVAAFAATCADFGLLFGLVEILHVWYVLATALGAAAGAMTNFLLNRYWSFEADDQAWHGQALRYAFVSAGSLLLNTWGVFAVTEGLRIHYAVSVIIVSIVVAVAYNFPLQRYFVFGGGRK
jgi:putative flippase GtrA